MENRGITEQNYTVCPKIYEDHNARQILNFVIENSPLIINKWDKNIKMVETNGAVTERFGIATKEEFVTRFHELSPKFQPCGTLSSVKSNALIKKGFELGRLRFEWMHQHINGTLIPCEIHFVRYDDPTDGESYLYAYNIDLSELKESMRREEESETRGLAMFNNSPIFIEYWDKDANLIDCNKITLDTFEFETKESYIANTNSIFEPTQVDGTSGIDYLKKNISLTMEKGYHRFEFHCRMKSGKLLIVDVEAVKIKQGNEDFVITYGTDITMLQESMNLLAEAEERSDLVLQNVPVACFIVDKELNVIDCNKEALKLAERKTKLESKLAFRASARNIDDDIIEHHLKTAIIKGTHVFTMEVFVKGTMVPVEITMVYLNYRMQDLFALYIKDLRIITKMAEEMRRAEIAEENSQAKSRFLARMSHEIRTPITAVLGVSEINLKKKALPMDIANAFTRIHSASRVLLSIINDILDLSRIEAGRMSIINEKYDLASLISDTINLNLFHLGSKQLDFRISIDPDLPAYVIGDEIRIKQIYNNLISNAFKYTDKGYVKFSMKSYPINYDHVMIEMVLEDSGQGMTQEELKALSDEYTRFNEKKNRFVEGTGIGIQIVRGLVDLLNATMKMESKPQEGTIITISIPQEIVTEETLGEEVADSIQGFKYISHSFNKSLTLELEPMPYGSVLIVDDVETNIYVAKGMVEMYQISVDVCYNGYDAIEKIKNGNVYDIIFMDHMMPDIDGVETLKNIRSFGYEEPVVALTANALVGTAQEFLDYGFDGFVAKPIEMVQLDEVLKRFIQEKQTDATIEAARLQAGQKNVNKEILDFVADPKSSDSEFAKKMRRDFVRGQRNTRDTIEKAIKTNDFKTAHRIAHTIKGTAGLIGEKILENLAQTVELLFKNIIYNSTAHDHDEPLTQNELDQVNEMLVELDSVIMRFNLDQEKTQTKKLDSKSLLPTLKRLQPLLRAHSMDSIELIEEIRGVPETAVLIHQIDQLDFSPALTTLEVLMDILKEQ